MATTILVLVCIPVLTKVGVVEIGPIEIIECVQYRIVNEPITMLIANVSSLPGSITVDAVLSYSSLLRFTVIMLGILGHGDQH